MQGKVRLQTKRFNQMTQGRAMQGVIQAVQACLKRVGSVGNESVNEFYEFFRGIVRRPLAVIRIAGFDGLIAKLRLRSILSQCSPGRERKASLADDDNGSR